MSLNTKLLASLVATQTSPVDLGTGNFPLSMEARILLANGVGANQADRLYTKRHTIIASNTTTLDVATGGGLLDVFGAAFALAKIKAIFVKALSTNVNNVNVTRPAANGVPWQVAAGDATPVLPGGTLLWVAPNLAAIGVVAATADLIDLVNSGAGSSVICDIAIIGASA
jgi:hypothetical protein